MIRNQQQMKNTVNVHILAPFHFASPVALIYCKLSNHGITCDTVLWVHQCHSITCNTFTVLWVHKCWGSVFVDLVIPGHSCPPVYIDPHKINEDVNCYEMFDDSN